MHAIPVARPFLVLLILAAAAHGQAPEPASPPDGRRLVYELPVDALQRTLQKEPKRDLEQLLDQMVRTVAARVGDEVSVRRHAASGFTVDVPPKLVPQVAALRRWIEAVGKLEMRIVADVDFVDGQVKFDMRAEKGRLEAWLKAENRKLVLEDPSSIRRFNDDPKQGPMQFGNLAWYPRQLRPDPKHKDQWDPSWTAFPALQQATVKVYDDAQWNNGRVPDAVQKKPEQEQFLVELVALNLRERGFTGEDLKPAGITSRPDQTGSPAVLYELNDALKTEYAAWSGKYIGKASAIVLNGSVQSAPTFRSRIPGRGQISGSFTQQEVDDLVIVLKSGSLPVAPKFVAEEPLPASEFGPRGK